MEVEHVQGCSPVENRIARSSIGRTQARGAFEAETQRVAWIRSFSISRESKPISVRYSQAQLYSCSVQARVNKCTGVVMAVYGYIRVSMGRQAEEGESLGAQQRTIEGLRDDARLHHRSRVCGARGLRLQEAHRPVRRGQALGDPKGWRCGTHSKAGSNVPLHSTPLMS